MKYKLTVLLVCAASLLCSCGQIKSPDPANQGKDTNTVVTRAPYVVTDTDIIDNTTVEIPTVDNKIISDEPISIYYFNEADENGVMQLSESIAVQMNFTCDVAALYFSCPSMNDSLGTLVFSVYPFKDSYEASVSETALFEKSFENYADNALIKLEDGKPIPAGEYIVLLTSPDPENGVGAWTKLNVFEGQRVYADGYFQPEVSLQIQLTYTKTPENKYGKLSLK